MVTYLDSLVQLYCEEGGTLQTNITDIVGSARTGWTILGLTHSWQRVLSRSTLLRLQGALQGHLSKADPAFHSLPKSKPLRFRFLGTVLGTDSVGCAFCAHPRSEQLR